MCFTLSFLYTLAIFAVNSICFSLIFIKLKSMCWTMCHWICFFLSSISLIVSLCFFVFNEIQIDVKFWNIEISSNYLFPNHFQCKIILVRFFRSFGCEMFGRFGLFIVREIWQSIFTALTFFVTNFTNFILLNFMNCHSSFVNTNF